MQKYLIIILFLCLMQGKLLAIIVENKTDSTIQLLCENNMNQIQEKKTHLSQSIQAGKSLTCFWPEFLIKASDRTFIISKNMITDNKTRVVVELNKFLKEVTVILKNEEICYGDFEF